MKAFLRPIVIPWLAVTAAGAVFGQPLVVAGGLVATAFALMVTVMRDVRARREELGLDSLSPQDRSKLVPIRRLREQLEALVAGNRGSPSLAVIGPEAVEESRRIFAQCVSLLQLQRQIRDALREQNADAEVRSLEAKVEAAASEGERAALQSALDARRLEASHFAKMKEALQTAEGGITQAEAALSEIKARLSVAVTDDALSDTSSDDLRETLGRLKALSKGFEEAEMFLKDQVE
jgi:hypothetical protein